MGSFVWLSFLLSWSEDLQGIGLLCCRLPHITLTNQLLWDKSLQNEQRVAVGTFDVPDVGTGKPGGELQGILVWLWAWEVDLQRAQVVLFLHGASVDAGRLVLSQLLNGNHVAGVVFAAGHLFGFLGVLSPTGCQMVLESAEWNPVVRIVRADF